MKTKDLGLLKARFSQSMNTRTDTLEDTVESLEFPDALYRGSNEMSFPRVTLSAVEGKAGIQITEFRSLTFKSEWNQRNPPKRPCRAGAAMALPVGFKKFFITQK